MQKLASRTRCVTRVTADGGHNDDAPPGSPFHPSNLLPYLLTRIPFGEVRQPPVTQSIANHAGYWYFGTRRAATHPTPTSAAANVDCNADTSTDPW